MESPQALKPPAPQTAGVHTEGQTNEGSPLVPPAFRVVFECPACGNRIEFDGSIPLGGGPTHLMPDRVKEHARLPAFQAAVLRLAATGESDKEIARQLSVPLDRVKHAIRSSLERLNARNRTEAVVQAIAAGII